MKLRIKKSNCLFFALGLYYRRLSKGKHGYVISRRSRYGWFPHFMYQYKGHARIRQVGFVPSDPKFKRCPPPFFTGKVKWGDE